MLKKIDVRFYKEKTCFAFVQLVNRKKENNGKKRMEIKEGKKETVIRQEHSIQNG